MAGLTRLDFGDSLWQRRPAMTICPRSRWALPALARLVMIVRSSMIDELNQP
jgi:ABC-type dipeptide/oligopeptide/nickel transport system permease component